jgi:type I restriction enzyme, S subunit
MSVEGWESKPLSELLTLIMDFRGRTPKKLDMEWGGGEIPALSANNVEMGKINFSKECYLGSDTLYKKWMTKGNTQEGDVILTTEAPLGNVALIPDERRYILSQRVILLRADSSHLYNDYLSHYLMSEFFQNLMRQQSSGTTATGIQRAKLEPLPIKFPTSKLEQTQIAAILSTVDRMIAQTEAIIAKQQRIKTGLMQDLLTKGIDENGNIRSEETHEFKDSAIGRIPVEWGVVTLDDISTKITDGDHHTPKRSIEGIFLLSARNILNGSLTLSDVDYVSESEYQRMIKRCYPEAGDIFISCSGTIGRVCEVPVWLKCVLVRSAALVKLDKSKIQSRFAEWILRSDLLQMQIQVSQRQAAQPNLFQSEIASLNFAKPMLYEQDCISKILDVHQSLIEKETLCLEKLKITKAGLMQDLLMGKVRVTELLKDPEVVSL